MQQKITKYTNPLPSQHLSVSWGHSVEVIDTSTTFRVLLQNPNGLSVLHQPLSLLHNLCTSCDLGTSVLYLPETNTNWDLPHLRDKFASLTHNTWQTSVYQSSKSPETFLSDHQPGGTATIVCDNWVARILHRGEDPFGFGRWTYVTLRGKGQHKVTIITAYKASPTSGDTTPPPIIFTRPTSLGVSSYASRS